MKNNKNKKAALDFNETVPLVFFWLAGMVGMAFIAFNAMGVDMSGWNLMSLDFLVTGMVWKLAVNKASRVDKVLKECYNEVARRSKAKLGYGSYDLLSKQQSRFSSMVQRSFPSCPVAY
ncbi:MAG: hypothetical protein Q9O24_08390 [Gammaproteobacteria bacterium]|nr:hypothetical protein [Gammaproteobacteria bacterium]